MATTLTSQRLKLALASTPPQQIQMQKSRPARSNIAQAARASQTAHASAQLSVGNSSEQTFGLARRIRAHVVKEEEQNHGTKSCESVKVNGGNNKLPTSAFNSFSHLKQHLQGQAAAAAAAKRVKQPTWKSSTSALDSSQQAIERRRRGAGATASLTAATSLLQLNTTTSASPNWQSAPTSAFRQQQQQQQQIANQRRASSLAAEIIKSRAGSTQHLETLREGQPGAPRRLITQSRVLAPTQRAKSVVALNTYATTTRSAAPTRKSRSPATSCSSSARAHIHRNKHTALGAPKLPPPPPPPRPAAVTNSRVRQGVLFARRQLHLTPVPPAVSASSPVPASKTQQARTLVQTSASTNTTATTCRRQLTRLTRAQPRPLAAKKQAVAATSPTTTIANKLASLAGTTGHGAGTTRQRAHLLFESASRRARANHSQSHNEKKLSLDSSSSSSLDAPVAHIKRPRADPEQAQSSGQIEKRRASLAAPNTGEQTYRRRWSSLESGSANEASSTPVSCSSLSSSSSSSCLVVAVSPRNPAPVDTHDERSGRQRRRRRHSSATAPAAATTGNRHAAAKADAAVGAGRARQHDLVVVAAAAASASAVDPLANTREQQEKVPNANHDDDERICDSHTTRQQTNLDYSSSILIDSSDKLFLQKQQQPEPPGQALIICQSPLTSNLDSNQRPEAAAAAAAASDVHNNNNNNNNSNNRCVCIVGRQPPSYIENANCGAADCPNNECFDSNSLKHQPRQRQSIEEEDVSARLRVADQAFSIRDKQDDNVENEPMVLSTDEPQDYQSGQIDQLESTQVASSPLSQLHQRQQQRRRQSQSSSPMSCDLGVRDENTSLVAIVSSTGANETTTTISEQPSKAKTTHLGGQICDPSERRASSSQVEMPAQLKVINIEQIQNQEIVQPTPTVAGASEDDESSADELGPASKKHQPESIVATTQAPSIKSNAKTDHQISICQEPIGDIYDLETRPFARGKFAQVKRCVRRDTRQCFAAKCIKKRRRLVDIKHEILLEIEALKLSYQTEYIVKLYEVYETPNEMVLILEMANGGELQRVLDDEEAIEEPLVRRMTKQILEGLVHLHDNHIAHLDIKPQNLLLTEPFPNGNVKLCDFGISRRITKDCEIRDICGTPDYVAPEILRYDPISLATDMWSLGVLTYVLLSGYSPFGSENKQQTFCNITQANLDFPIEIFGKISEEAVDFIRKLIVREPSGRLTSRQARSHHWINQ